MIEVLQLVFGPNVTYQSESRRQEGPAVEHNGLRYKLVLCRDNSIPLPWVCLNVESLSSKPAGKKNEIGSIGFLKDCEWTSVDISRTDNEQKIIDQIDEATFRRLICDLAIPTEAKKLKLPMLIDFSNPEALKCTDVVLVIQEHEFHVNKGTLANLSTKFAQLFLENPEQTRYQVDFLFPDECQMILEVVHFATDIDEKNILNVLAVAHRIGMASITTKCLRDLQKLPDAQVSYKKRINLADSCQLKELLDSTLKLLKSPVQVKNALPDPLENLRDSTVLKLLERMSEVVVEEGHYIPSHNDYIVNPRRRAPWRADDDEW